jgi:drug/metabolite transporter (DMT)-like permease
VAYIWMFFSALAFATMGAFARGLRESVSWELIALVRSMVVLVLIGALMVASGVKLHFWRPGALWARSIAGSLSMLFVFFSLSRLPVSIVVTLMNLAPIWVAVASWFLFPGARSKGIWPALGVGLAGVVLIQRPQLAEGNLAALAPLAASFLLAVVMIALHRAQMIDTRAVVFHFAIISFVASSGLVLTSAMWRSLVISTDAITLGMLLGTGVAATLGQLFLTAAFAAGTPAKVSVVGLTQVGMALAYDVGIWGDAWSELSLIGIVLVVAPTAWLLSTEQHVLVEE